MTYVYAITRDVGSQTLHELRGIGGSIVRAVDSAGVTAVVSSVDSEEFGEQGLRRNLENLEWLEPTVRAHNGVVAEVGASAPVAPFGLATIYRDDDRVRAELSERAEAFREVLDRITGRTERGVKVYTEPIGCAADEPEEPSGAGTEGSGAAYLRNLRQRRKRQDRATNEAYQQADELHRRLGGLAEANRVHPPQNRELARYQGLMVLNAAYLVAPGRDGEFIAAVEDSARRVSGLRLELTGPWPPYSFATLRDEEQR